MPVILDIGDKLQHPLCIMLALEVIDIDILYLLPVELWGRQVATAVQLLIDRVDVARGMSGFCLASSQQSS